jgi:hypothetical protein
MTKITNGNKRYDLHTGNNFKHASYLGLFQNKKKKKKKLIYDRLSWCQAPIWDLWAIFLSPWNFLQIVACLLFCSALSGEMTGL